MLEKICLNNNVMNKVIELLLSRRQSARYESDCQDANSFLSRYPDSSPMWRLSVTSVINETRPQRPRCATWRGHAIHPSRNLLVIHEKK